MMIAKKNQVLLEFVIISAVALLILVVFLGILKDNLNRVADEKDKVAMQNLGNAIRNEVILASQVHDNYVRRFEIPLSLNSNPYALTLHPSGMSIWMESNKSHFVAFPHDVQGKFLSENEPDFLDYCISKNADDIRISRNQVSLENSVGKNSFDVADGGEITLYVRANCIFNLQSLEFELHYSPENMTDYKPVKPVNDLLITANPVEPMSRWGSKDWNVFFYDDDCGLGCDKITIIGIGHGPSGSGYVAAFNFTASGSGVTRVEIRELELIDASISPTSSGYIPPTVVNAEVTII